MGSTLTELLAPMDVEVEVDHEPTWNVAPTDMHPVVEWGAEGPMVSTRSWGFTAHQDGRKAPINARWESVHERPLFQKAIERHRIAVPCTGWYEWQASPLGRHPHHLRPLGGGPCWMAGIRADGRGGFAVLTKEAQASIRHIHTRMPVLLANHEVLPWLSEHVPPAGPEGIEHWPVGMDVNRVGAVGPNLASPLTTLF